jgi:hypothetical protein
VSFKDFFFLKPLTSEVEQNVAAKVRDIYRLWFDLLRNILTISVLFALYEKIRQRLVAFLDDNLAGNLCRILDERSERGSLGYIPLPRAALA